MTSKFREKCRAYLRFWKPLSVLFFLYLSQGLPFGFAGAALPLYLKGRGLSLTDIGLASALGLPWMLKFVWAPLLDRYWSPTFGRRKSWIVPMQCLLLGSVIVTSFLLEGNLLALGIAVLCMNLFAATQDIAVDGFAIDQLKPHALGLGNTVQSVGFKLGTMLAGGLLLVLAGSRGWDVMMLVMGTLILAALIPILLFKEKPVKDSASLGIGAKLDEKPSLGAFYAHMGEMIRNRPFRVVLLFVFVYKMGEELTQTMYNQFLLARGFSLEQIGATMGSFGTVSSFLGSVFGGVLIVKFSPWKMLGVAGVLRLLPLTWQWWLTQTDVTPFEVVTAACSEYFCGGFMTTSMYAFLMGLVNKKAGATEYTALSCLENAGRQPAKMVSGYIAQTLGFHVLFLGGVVVAALAMLPWWLCRKWGKAADEAARAGVTEKSAETVETATA